MLYQFCSLVYSELFYIFVHLQISIFAKAIDYGWVKYNELKEWVALALKYPLQNRSNERVLSESIHGHTIFFVNLDMRPFPNRN